MTWIGFPTSKKYYASTQTCDIAFLNVVCGKHTTPLFSSPLNVAVYTNTPRATLPIPTQPIPKKKKHPHPLSKLRVYLIDTSDKGFRFRQVEITIHSSIEP
jgi:hypothetical protein